MATHTSLDLESRKLLEREPPSPQLKLFASKPLRLEVPELLMDLFTATRGQGCPRSFWGCLQYRIFRYEAKLIGQTVARETVCALPVSIFNF